MEHDSSSPPQSGMTRREFVRQAGKVSTVAAAGVILGDVSGTAKPQVSPSSGVVMMTAGELSHAIRARQVSCQEVMTAYLAHIEALNPKVNAIVSLQPREALMKQAAERDAELARGQYRGWMHGFPHAVKDLAATRGIRTTWGSPLLDTVPDYDSIFVERLRRAGVIILGKTNAPEFGLGSQSYNPVFGTTLNAYDQSKCAGGSSGGAAVSLALRMVPVADGSDMMGSLRNPAAFNNVIGFRTSFGRVPSGGEELFLEQLSVNGPMGRTVSDVAMLLSVMAGPDPRAPLSLEQDPAIFAEPLKRDFKGTRLAWLGDLGGHLQFEPGIADLCRASFKAFEAAGCAVEEAQPEYSADRMWDTWVTLRHWLTAGDLLELYQDVSKRNLMKPEAQWEVEAGLRLSAVHVYNASRARSEWYVAMQKLFHKYDYLLLPSAQVFPFDATVHWPKSINGVAMDTYHRWMEVVVPASLLGFPTINVPVGFNQHDLPMGMQIIGRHNADLAVLQMAYAYEQATDWVRAHLPALLRA
ncbi:MAG TPA: amidase [Terriglobales bacterium]|nr:amidase [Terriglobales bacterium]